MGTSSSFKGSKSSDAKDLRDAISEWFGEYESDSDDANLSVSEALPPRTDKAVQPRVTFDPSKLAPMVRLWKKGGGGGSSGAILGGVAIGSGGNRTNSGPQRSVSRVAGAAGRAGVLAAAYAGGERQTLEVAGLNYDQLRSLNDPLQVGQIIVETAFSAQADGSIEDSEARLIVSEVVAGILDGTQSSDPVDIVRRTI